MKILLICAGGMSTSILMKKMEKYWKKENKELDIRAVGLAAYKNIAKNYDVILLAPQVSYKLEEIKGNTEKPTAVIDSVDYAIADAGNIMELVEKINN